MPRPRPASVLAGRSAPFTVSPWQTVQRGGVVRGAVVEEEEEEEAVPDSPPPPPSPPNVDYGDADADAPYAGPPLTGGGYLAWHADGGVTGHWVVAGGPSLAVAGAVLPPPPTADACRWGDDRIVGLALYRSGQDEPAAVVLAHAGGGDCVSLTAPAPDPPPGPDARAALRRAGLEPVPGRPPAVSFTTRTLLSGDAAARYVSRFGSMDDDGSSASLVVNVGEFRVVGLVGPAAAVQELYDSDLDG